MSFLGFPWPKLCIAAITSFQNISFGVQAAFQETESFKELARNRYKVEAKKSEDYQRKEALSVQSEQIVPLCHFKNFFI